MNASRLTAEMNRRSGAAGFLFLYRRRRGECLSGDRLASIGLVPTALIERGKIGGNKGLTL